MLGILNDKADRFAGVGSQQASHLVDDPVLKILAQHAGRPQEQNQQWRKRQRRIEGNGGGVGQRIIGQKVASGIDEQAPGDSSFE